MHFLPDIYLLHWFFWFPVLSIWSNSGGNKSSSNTETSTTSGQNAPSATGGSQGIGSGSIGVAGTGAKYLEQGAVDQAGAQIGGVQGSSVQASGGGTVNIGDPQAVQTIAALAQNFADTVQSVGTGGGGSTVVTGSSPGGGASALTALPWNSIVWGLVIIAGLWAFLRGGKKT